MVYYKQLHAILTQLVECLLDVEKVSGSSPLYRTIRESVVLLKTKERPIFLPYGGFTKDV